jgi:DNA polymerase III subunit epsilon
LRLYPGTRSEESLTALFAQANVQAVRWRWHRWGFVMDPSAPFATAEFLVVDTETNGLGGDRCELTEIGAVLVGGGELHDRWETLVAAPTPLSRGIQRFTGITQAMVDQAPRAEDVLPELEGLLRGRVLVAHSAAFDRRVLRQAFERAGIAWPAPPVLCTVALARRFAPLVRQRKLGALASSLGIDVHVQHRALPDAETCARVFCALFPRLCAAASTVEEALAATRPARPRRVRAGATDGGRSLRGARKRRPDVSGLPDEPGVYIFRNASGQPLYVGKSVTLRTRARAHFAPSSASTDWALQAELVDHRATRSELGALLLERRLIRELRPPGNVRIKHEDRFVYIRCRFDIAFPVLEVSPQPAAGHAVNIGPLRGRHLAVELVEQLNSLFGLRHCGRKLPRRDHPSAYGQMGRCLSPCLHDLDPNVYRARLDAALALFTAGGDAAGAVLANVDEQMRAAAREERFERAAWLRRRRTRLAELLAQLDGVLAATHAQPRLVLAEHPRGGAWDAFWLVGGRVADWGPLTHHDDVARRTAAALRGGDGTGHSTWLAPHDVEDMRTVATWLASHPGSPELPLAPAPDPVVLRAFVGERQLDDGGADAARVEHVTGLRLPAHEREPDGAEPWRGRDAGERADLALAEPQLGSGLHLFAEP